MLKIIFSFLIVICLLNVRVSASEQTWILGDSISLDYEGEGYPPILQKMTNITYSNLARGRKRCDYVRDVEIKMINKSSGSAIVLCGINDLYQGNTSK